MKFIILILCYSFYVVNMQSIDPVLINMLRQRLVNEMTNSSLYDEIDLERVKTDEWTVKRFLKLSKGDVDNGFTLGKEAFKFRKSYRVNYMTDLHFPIEFYKVGALFAYEPDKEGRVVIYMKCRLYKYVPKLSDHLRKFMAHIVNKVDLQSGEKGFLIVWDLRGVGPSNWDLSMIRFLINACVNYIPDGMKSAYFVGFPPIMEPFARIGLQLTPENLRKRINFVNKEEFFKIVDPKNVPDFMGGTCHTNYRKVPEGAKSVYDLAQKYGYSSVEVEKLMKFYAKELNP